MTGNHRFTRTASFALGMLAAVPEFLPARVFRACRPFIGLLSRAAADQGRFGRAR